MKYSQIKIWPEIISYLPAQTALVSRKNEPNDLLLDWTNCTEIDSTGLTFLLVRLLKILTLGKNLRKWNAKQSLDPKVAAALGSLGVWKILRPFMETGALRPDLFVNEVPKDNCIEPVIIKNSMGTETISLPIYHLAFSSQSVNRREELEKFREWLYQQLVTLRKDFFFHHTQLVWILIEIAKNSADHTDKDAYFGMDVAVSPTRENMILTFAFGDLGVGIKQHIQNYYSKTLKKRIPHFSIYEAYYVAIQPGFSTAAAGVNKGVGMSLILEGSKGMNLSLSVFDAKSRGLLNCLNGRSHSEIRRVFFDLDTKVGFYYFGKLISGRS